MKIIFSNALFSQDLSYYTVLWELEKMFMCYSHKGFTELNLCVKVIII